MHDLFLRIPQQSLVDRNVIGLLRVPGLLQFFLTNAANVHMHTSNTILYNKGLNLNHFKQILLVPFLANIVRRRVDGQLCELPAK